MKTYGTVIIVRFGPPIYNFAQIDWEESTLLQRVCVRPHIDEELDNRKHIYNGIDAVLVSNELRSCSYGWVNAAQSKVAEGISPTVPPHYATSLNVVYFPQLGEARPYIPRVLAHLT